MPAQASIDRWITEVFKSASVKLQIWNSNVIYQILLEFSYHNNSQANNSMLYVVK